MTKNGTGIARFTSVGLAVLLLTGVAGSLVMGARARGAALEDTVTQARAIADGSLGLVFRPDDVDTVAADVRADQLTDQIGRVVVDPSDFDTVTLWSPDAQILYATEEGRIGNRLDGERERIRAALRGNPQTKAADGVVSVMVPLRFESGVGGPAAIELTTSAADVDAAGAPWRTMALFSGFALLFVGALLIWVMRHPEAPAPLREQRHRMKTPPAHAGQRPIAVPTLGMKEEGDARRKAEDRARAAEERLGVLQDQYRKTLDELQVAQNRVREATTARQDPGLEDRAMQAEQRAAMLEDHARSADERARALEDRSRELEDRARLFERQAQSTKAELDEMTRRLAERPAPSGDGDADDRVSATEQEAIGLRAELEGAQTQLSLIRRELETLRPQADRARDLQAEIDAIHADAQRAKDTSATSQAELSTKSKELEDLRAEVRALRTEEQRAAMLDDELRSIRAELESVTASHRAELIEREADLEAKVRATREEFQAELARLETQHAEELEARESAVGQRVASVEDAAQQRIDDVQRELEERTKRFENAEGEIAAAQAESARLASELAIARAELETTVEQLTEESAHARQAAERLQQLERQGAEASSGRDRLAAELEAATKDNADLNRRLQEIEARRQLELADADGRAEIDEILRVTQERLAGQTEKLIAAEERVHSLEREVEIAASKLEETESELRQQQMAAAMRHLRGEDAETPPAEGAPDTASAVPAGVIEDRRATTPFMKELSTDARKSLTRILGITQILKHKRDGKEQAQLVRQLAAHTRRLEHLVVDLADAERLVRGEIELTIRRTDLEPLVQRVVEESGVDADHEVLVQTERVVVAVDQLRTEQIIAGLVRASGDRTPPKKAITVRLRATEGGALITVEDPAPSSDVSIGPVVQRFAEAQGGETRVEGREDGGSAFTVFLPDGAGRERSETERPGTGALHIMVDEVESTASADGSVLVQELHRLSTAED